MALLPPTLAFSIPKPPPAGAVRVMCICDGFDADEEWPEYCAFPPRAGDMMQTNLGTTKKILEVIHSADIEGHPVVMLRLGNDTMGIQGD